MSETRVHLSKTIPTAYEALAAFSKQVAVAAAGAGIDDRLKELVMLHTSMINGCAFCVRVHVEAAGKVGITADEIAQLTTWRESGVFSERECAALELAEEFAHIHRGGVRDEVYNRVGSVFTPEEYAAISWICVSINAFNRVAIAGRYPVPARERA